MHCGIVDITSKAERNQRHQKETFSQEYVQYNIKYIYCVTIILSLGLSLQGAPSEQLSFVKNCNTNNELNQAFKKTPLIR